MLQNFLQFFLFDHQIKSFFKVKFSIEDLRCFTMFLPFLNFNESQVFFKYLFASWNFGICLMKEDNEGILKLEYFGVECVSDLEGMR